MQQRQKARDQTLLTQQLVEEERRKAEEKLQRRVERMKTQQTQNGASAATHSPPGGSLVHTVLHTVLCVLMRKHRMCTLSLYSCNDVFISTHVCVYTWRCVARVCQ